MVSTTSQFGCSGFEESYRTFLNDDSASHCKNFEESNVEEGYLVATSSLDPQSVQAIDSLDPLSVQAIDPGEPIVPVIPPSEPVAGCPLHTVAAATELMPAIPTWTECSPTVLERASGSSGCLSNYTAAQIRSLWNLSKISKILGTTTQCIEFAEERGLILKQKMCTYHKRPMVLSTGGQLGVFRCRKSVCRTRGISRAKGTLFENVKLPIPMLFRLMYLFSQKYTYSQAQRETVENDIVLSSRTIAEWYTYCREAISVYVLDHQVYETKIGGPGKIVQLDESKFGKRKYNWTGRHIEGHRVLGMIENGSDDLRLEVCPENDQSPESVVPFIVKHVEEGTEIHTDFQIPNDCLSQHGYILRKVTYSDPVNKFAPHTQRIKSHWRHLKMMYNKDSYKNDFTDWLVEYNWRRNIRINHKDEFEELLNVIQHVFKVN